MENAMEASYFDMVTGRAPAELRIDNVRFKHKVTPGDVLQIEAELTSPVRRGIAQMECKAFVGDTLVCEAELMAQIAKTKPDYKQ